MTPLEIGILLHIYACRGPIENADSPAQQEAIAQFMGDDLIAVAEVREYGSHPYILKPRGKAMVEALTTLPLPVEAWRLPGSDRVLL